MSDDILPGGYRGPGGFMPPVPVPPGGGTLAQTYAAGAAPGDQTMTLLDAKGGAITVDATNALFTNANAFSILGTTGNAINFPRAGGMAGAQDHILNIFVPDEGTTDADGKGITITADAGGSGGTGNHNGGGILLVPGAGAGFGSSGIVAVAGNLTIFGDVQSNNLHLGPLGAIDGVLEIDFAGAGATIRTATAFGSMLDLQAYDTIGVTFTSFITLTAGNPPTCVLAGTVTGTTQAVSTNNTTLATTAFVNAAMGGSHPTLATTYGFGAGADQTMILTNARGGAVIVNGTTPGPAFTGVTIFELLAQGGSINFYSRGGFDTFSTMSVPAAVGAVWDEVAFLASTIILTGAPAVETLLAQVHVGAGIINGAGNTVSDAYNFLVDAAPAGTASITRPWSLGAAGAVQFRGGLAMGGNILPPNENDIAFGAGAVGLSEANTGRLGYLAGGTQAFMVSTNGGAYVPLLVGPAAGGFTQGSVPFGSATGTLTQDNANFFWDNTNKRLGIGATPTATLHVVQPIVNAAVPTAFLLVGGAHTAITAGTEDIDVNFNLSATKTWATGAIATQRDFIIQARTYAFAAASTVTTAATFDITGDPIVGANATITNKFALRVESGHTQFCGTAAITAPVALSTWRGLEFATSTLTLTAGGAAPTSLSACYLNAPVITQTAGAVYTIATATTLTIAGPPTAGAGGGVAPVITAAASLVVLTGSIVCQGAALATNATDGFLYIPTCAGTPIGVPTTRTGTVPIVFDTTHHRLYLYDNGSWT
jgi:hypothetical protein